MMLTFNYLSILILSILLFFITLVISKKSKNKREKSTPFECGFNFFNKSRMPFSMRFFLIAIIFIIFDVEIAIIIPLVKMIMKANLMKWTLLVYLFLMILVIGILIEWKEHSFEWKN